MLPTIKWHTTRVAQLFRAFKSAAGQFERGGNHRRQLDVLCGAADPGGTAGAPRVPSSTADLIISPLGVGE